MYSDREYIVYTKHAFRENVISCKNFKSFPSNSEELTLEMLENSKIDLQDTCELLESHSKHTP